MKKLAEDETMNRTLIDLDGQSDLPITEANLERLGNNSIVDDLHSHSKLVAPDGSTDPALHINNAGKVCGLKLPIETTLACNANYEIGDLFIYQNTAQGKIYIVLKTAEGSAKAAMMNNDLTLT